MLIILATILTITTPTGTLSPDSCLIYLGVFRILLGVGVGGDYPMSATITSDRANLRKRGTMLAYIFSNQGWGSFVGALATIIVLECYRHVMNDEGKTSKVDGVWRIVVGLSLIPAFGTLYQRLTMPEAERFQKSQKQRVEMDHITELKKANESTGVEAETHSASTPSEPEEIEAVVKKKAHFGGEFSRNTFPARS
jgi:MFS transporter, PHS family, inorganic phosphate transporter